jgi:hypothetical protein
LRSAALETARRLQIVVDCGWKLAESQERSAGPNAKQILAYFLRNPEAADSIEGIARWRLLEMIVQRTLTETEGAIRWLVNEGYLREKEVPGSQSIFFLNEEKAAEARRLLDEKQREK